MKGVELLFLAIAALQPGQFQIVMEGRDPTTLANLDHVLRGTCDGRQASATIERAIRGRAGRLTIRVGRFVRQVPDGSWGEGCSEAVFLPRGSPVTDRASSSGHASPGWMARAGSTSTFNP